MIVAFQGCPYYGRPFQYHQNVEINVKNVFPHYRSKGTVRGSKARTSKKSIEMSVFSILTCTSTVAIATL